MQAKTGFHTPTFNHILPFLYEKGMIPIRNHKQSKSFINHSTPSVLCYQNALKQFFNLDLKSSID